LIKDSRLDLFNTMIDSLTIFSYDPDTEEIGTEPAAELDDPRGPVKFNLPPGYYHISFSTQCVEKQVGLTNSEISENELTVVNFWDFVNYSSEKMKAAFYCFSN